MKIIIDIIRYERNVEIAAPIIEKCGIRMKFSEKLINRPKKLTRSK